MGISIYTGFCQKNNFFLLFCLDLYFFVIYLLSLTISASFSQHRSGHISRSSYIENGRAEQVKRGSHFALFGKRLYLFHKFRLRPYLPPAPWSGKPEEAGFSPGQVCVVTAMLAVFAPNMGAATVVLRHFITLSFDCNFV